MTLKYRFRFVEANTRLGERKTRTKTLELPRELFDHYDVDRMMKAFWSEADKFTLHDSNVSLKSIKVGRTEFML